jgi:hypothetical protein
MVDQVFTLISGTADGILDLRQKLFNGQFPPTN